MMDGLLFPSTQNFESTYRIVVMVLVVDLVYLPHNAGQNNNDCRGRFQKKGPLEERMTDRL